MNPLCYATSEAFSLDDLPTEFTREMYIAMKNRILELENKCHGRSGEHSPSSSVSPSPNMSRKRKGFGSMDMCCCENGHCYYHHHHHHHHRNFHSGEEIERSLKRHNHHHHHHHEIASGSPGTL